MFIANDADAMRDELLAYGVSKADVIRDLSMETQGWPYVFGANGEKCTPENRRRCMNNRPDHADKIKAACPVLSGKAASCSECKWNGCLIFDCKGFTYWLLKMASLYLYGSTVSTQWETRGNWVAQGDIAGMPDNLVCCVFRDGHTGMYTGDGWVRHCSTTVKEEPLPGNPRWLRYAIPAGLYTNEELREAGVVFEESRNIPTLRRGAEGEAVKTLQTLLNDRTGAGLTVDGKFGAKTEQAVKAFQKENGLTADGVVGPKTRAALGMEYSAPETEPPEKPDAGTDDGIDAPDLDDEEIAECVWLSMYEWRTLKAAIDAAMGVIKKHEGE